MAYLRLDRLTTYQSERKLVLSRRPGVTAYVLMNAYTSPGRSELLKLAVPGRSVSRSLYMRKYKTV
jgi:hypothetical protein